MGSDYAPVQVLVRDGVMQVGSDTYALRTITHIGQRKLVADKGAAWRKFFVRLLLTMIFGGVLVGALGDAWTLALVAVLAVLAWRLVTVLRLPPVYGLVIGTAGVEREAVWGTDRGEIDQLSADLTAAVGKLDLPPMTFNITHAVGRNEVINQYGAGSIGKATHHGAGNIETR
ncbi:hypothetical protein Nocox_24175 [Nonomuraea coxensis DSM 45129]|uniref:Uncharacterized protein n=1 Tax=Nonomuraea coxensis DSM 45129 TaxID=1122611 RepID=A0ABX8U483_9ACTN|nr:DUF6232 family protein [Nonomuraea coxensis]QYC42438.1 hypothetical protein Nocox_24175 [Nonomuraea coxensis DSM 45129]